MRGLICDDHPLVREALAAAIRDNWPGVELAQAQDYPAAWALAETQPDFCLVDLAMPGAAPAEGVAGLRARAPTAALVVVTGLSDATLLAEVRACGVAAIVAKTAEPRAMIEAIWSAVPGLQALDATYLPARQREVLGLLSRGLTNKKIAIELGISPATVKVHVARLTGWLGAANRTDAVARAQRARII